MQEKKIEPGNTHTTEIPLVTVWDYFGDQNFGMSQYFRGLQGDGHDVVFHQMLYKAKLGNNLPPVLRKGGIKWFKWVNWELRHQLRSFPWILGGQQFVHLFDERDLQFALVLVYDLLTLDYPDDAGKRKACQNIKHDISHIKRAHTIVTISQYSKQRIVAHYNIDPERINVIPGGVDRKRFKSLSEDKKREMKRRFGLPSDRFVILYVGSEQRRKNLPSLIYGLEKVAKSFPEILFVKIGVAQSQQGNREFRDAIANANLSEFVMNLGHLPDETLLDWYGVADIFVFPSIGEGFGLPILEAMAAGVPVITTRCCSIPEIIGNSAITIDDPFSAAEWASAIGELISSPHKRLEYVNLGYERAVHFDWQESRRKLSHLWQEVQSS